MQTAAAETVKVELFYETLNAAVRAFFVEQFKPASDVVLNLTDVTLRLYPYGKTTKGEPGADNVITYSCPYGDQQCRANKFHVSGLHSLLFHFLKFF